MSRPNYFMIAFGGTSKGLTELITQYINEPLKSLRSNNIKVIGTKIENVFFIVDKDNETTEEEISHLYRNYQYNTGINLISSYKEYDFFVKKVDSNLQII